MAMPPAYLGIPQRPKAGVQLRIDNLQKLPAVCFAPFIRLKDLSPAFIGQQLVGRHTNKKEVAAHVRCHSQQQAVARV